MVLFLKEKKKQNHAPHGQPLPSILFVYYFWYFYHGGFFKDVY